MEKFDFCGWATRNDLKCSDGRIIRKDAFKHCDGLTVPLVWNHDHEDPYRIVGHALLENRADGVYTYGAFNDTELGKTAKIYVEHGDITQLSIYANQLEQQGPNVMHGRIREVSLVMAGANPGAKIESVMAHSDELSEEGIILSLGEDFSLYHSDEQTNSELESEPEDKETEEVSESESEEPETEEVSESESEEQETEEISESEGEEVVQHADDDKESAEKPKKKTAKEVFDELTEEQQNVVYALIGLARDEADSDDDDEKSEGGNESMKHNLFDQEDIERGNVLTHSDQAAILALAKSSGCGSLQEAISKYAADNNLQHADIEISGFVQTGNGNVTTMFPEYVEAHPSRTPELITNNMDWVNAIMSKTQKIPHGRVRTSHVDIRNIDALKAKGYKKGDQTKLTGNYELVRRTTDPQTVYVTSALHRDDVVDIEDFDYVQFQYNIDQMSLKETLAVATLLGDERPDEDPEKIFPDKVRPIWKDDELYTIHKDINFDAMAKELQGSDTTANFGENFIYAEAMVNALRKARKDYRGTGKPDMFITTDMLSTMILARDRNGRRIYSTETELAAALGVANIYEVTQMEDKVRTDSDGKKHKLLAICVNMADYGYGASKGGDITHFTDFDIKFNQLQSLLETRKSGQLTRIKSAIVIEELVEEAAG
jgi:hypothetical protein